MERLITLGFSPHRIETLPLAEKLMKEHDIIILEEPYNELFFSFLENKISLETYVENNDFWFPNFVKRASLILKNLYNQGKKIFQIEPYLERVLLIQNKLAEGQTPEEILQDSKLKEVYHIENRAIGKLLDYYKTSLENNFSKIIEAVKVFSKADAERFRLRDKLRAKAILKILPERGKVYVEAGTIHIYLKKLLHIYLGKQWKIRHKFLLENYFKPLTGKSWIFPPGELLTLRYILKRKEDPQAENLLAARSLIYIKIIPKEELVPSEKELFPHANKELKAIQMVNKLSFNECATLYRELFFIKDPDKAKKVVENFLKHRKINP
ncbi:MAG: hypothetical protein OD816_000382 [Thermodesulfobacterium sp.]|uniref:Uncharacterized protein n=1 Tax=Candidatus Thermodesulfobacterium syntrophicum TaxID=3060442 RepID=A0AAE3NZ76_9BACT|nr:hypothetical protein [Candidatus Thermodesulfobacterium syntrophicum]